MGSLIWKRVAVDKKSTISSLSTAPLRLIGIMLGRLQTTVDDYIDAYVSLLDRVFQKRRCWLGNKDGFKRTNSEELERAIKEIVVKQELEEDALLRDEVERSAKCEPMSTVEVTVRYHLMTHHPVSCHRMSYYLFPLPIH